MAMRDLRRIMVGHAPEGMPNAIVLGVCEGERGRNGNRSGGERCEGIEMPTRVEGGMWKGLGRQGVLRAQGAAQLSYNWVIGAGPEMGWPISGGSASSHGASEEGRAVPGEPLGRFGWLAWRDCSMKGVMAAKNAKGAKGQEDRMSPM